MNNWDFKVPDIVAGKVAPLYVQQKLLKEEAEREAHKKQLRQNILISAISTVAGVILSNIDRIFHFFMALKS